MACVQVDAHEIDPPIVLYLRAVVSSSARIKNKTTSVNADESL